jgi:hypothetical protein
MPHLLDLCSREITCVNQVPGPISTWAVARVKFQRLLNCHHDIEWENCETRGLLCIEDKKLIVQDRDTAFDIEYYTREGALNWELIEVF